MDGCKLSESDKEQNKQTKKNIKAVTFWYENEKKIIVISFDEN